MQLSEFSTLSFDCYGTLIDWETGIHTALQPLLSKTEIGRDEALEVFAAHESRQQAQTPGMLYSDVLHAVYGQLAAYWGVPMDAAEQARFGQSVAEWPAFADTPPALQYLARHFKLVILSNVDHHSFSGSLPRLGVTFEAVYTAQDIGSYKPDQANFNYMLAHLARRGIEKRDILHTAQSLFHDHVPANQAGLATAWINRRHGAEGWGATMPPPVQARLDFQFNSMADLAQAHREASGPA